MPWCIAQVSALIQRPRTSSCGVFHSHHDPDQLTRQKSPVRRLFWDPIYVGKNTHAVTLRPRIPCDIEPREPEILGGREEGDRDQATCKL